MVHFALIDKYVFKTYICNYCMATTMCIFIENFFEKVLLYHRIQTS